LIKVNHLLWLSDEEELLVDKTLGRPPAVTHDHDANAEENIRAIALAEVLEFSTCV